MKGKLPIYELVLLEEENGVDTVSFVDAPAIEQDFFAFNNHDYKFKTDTERRIVMGAMMIPDIPIYRNQGGQEFMVKFSKSTIEKVARKFFFKGFNKSVNVNHDEKVSGVHLYQSFITDKQMGIEAPKGHPKVPDGTWFGVYHITNSKVWKDVLEKKFNGFSIEGHFERQLQKMSTQEEVDFLFKDL